MVRLLPGNIIDVLFGGDVQATPEQKQQALRAARHRRARSSHQYMALDRPDALRTATSAARYRSQQPDLGRSSATRSRSRSSSSSSGSLIARRRSGSRSASSRPSGATAPPTTPRASAGLVGIIDPELLARDAAADLHSRASSTGSRRSRTSRSTQDPAQNLQQFIFPAISISVFTLAIVMRHGARDDARGARASTTCAPRAPRACRAGRVLRKHALRNALIPVVTVVGVRGRRADRRRRDRRDHLRPARRSATRCCIAIFSRDYPIIQATRAADRGRLRRLQPVVDLLYGVLDPRISGRHDRATDRSLGAPCPRRRARAPGALAQPDRDRRRGDRRLHASCVALFGPYIWTIDPNAPVVRPASRARAGRTRWAPTTSAATRSRASSTARRSRSQVGVVAVAIALVVRRR